jgi:redox-sensitive bicupin YhaK (pirin superfamily)
MITVRKANERGETKTGWLESYHTFSFNNYFDQRYMGFGDLRVINDDVVKGGTGFGTHSHRDMEIITYILKGAVQHRDSSGGHGIIKAGEVQRMTAGTGVAHSEFNASKTEDVHFLQIWILPERQGLKPGYEQRAFPAEEHTGKFGLIASRDGGDSALTIHQDASVYATHLNPGQEAEQPLKAGRKGWLHVALGSVEIDGQKLEQGDGAAITDEGSVRVKGLTEAEVLLFDLA